MKVVAVTIAAGRHRHLLAQRTHLRALADAPHHVVVSMGDDEIPGLLRHDRDVEVLTLPARRPLPLAEARNAGIDRAVALGADLVVVLDVDCLPGPDLVDRYVAAAVETAGRHTLLCGPVTYLGADDGSPAPGDLVRLTAPHPARPVPPDDELVRDGEHRLFWSLSFALTPSTWAALGGFCTDYDGYGGEDTDLGLVARSRDVELVWVGGAHAYHQHHPVSKPPVEHLDDILRNAETFHRRWGSWPMEGWLREFEERGLAHFDGTRWVHGPA